MKKHNWKKLKRKGKRYMPGRIFNTMTLEQAEEHFKAAQRREHLTRFPWYIRLFKKLTYRFYARHET